MPKQPSRFSEKNLDLINSRFQKVVGVEISNDFLFDLISEGIPESPDFPTKMLVFAIVTDIIAFALSIASLSGVLLVLFWAYQAIIFAIVYMWASSKGGDFFASGVKDARNNKKMNEIIDKLLKKKLISFGITRAIPFANIIWGNWMIILLVHNKKTKVVQGITDGLSLVKGTDIPKKIGRAIRAQDTSIVRRARNRQAGYESA